MTTSAAAPELSALLALQDLDSALYREQHRRANLPERSQLAQLHKRATETGAERARAAELLAEVAGRQEAAERELKATEDRAAQVNARLYGGTVTASRELQAMATDVEGLRHRASELADRVLELMEERDPLDAEVAGYDAGLALLADEEVQLTESLVKAEAEVDASLASLAPQRKAAAEAVPSGLLATYERLRAKLGGVAVSRLVGGLCDGCHLSIPAVELDRIRHEPPGTLEYCDQCGRILVFST